MRNCGLLSWELVLKFVCIAIELSDHIINFLDVMLQSVLLIFYLFVPDHSQVSLDVSLSSVRISKHLKVGSAELPRQNVSLSLHEGVLLAEELFANYVGTEARLDH